MVAIARTRILIGNMFVSKKMVCNGMLVYLHVVGFSKEVKIDANLGKRWDRYYGKYKLALKVKNTIGGGINKLECRVDIILSEKIDRLHILLGERANVNPSPTWSCWIARPSRDLHAFERQISR